MPLLPRPEHRINYDNIDLVLVKIQIRIDLSSQLVSDVPDYLGRKFNFGFQYKYYFFSTSHHIRVHNP